MGCAAWCFVLLVVAAAPDEPAPVAPEVELDEGVIAAIGLEVRERAGGVEVVSVAADSPAEEAGVRAGQRIVSVGKTRVFNIADLDRALRRYQPGHAVEFHVEEASEYGGLRLGLSGTGSALTGQKNTLSGMIGLLGLIPIDGPLSAAISVSYTAIGPRPNYGRDAITPMLGLHAEMPLLGDQLAGVARVMAGPNITRYSGDQRGLFFVLRPPWKQEPLTVAGSLGVRTWIFEAVATAAFGPAEGFNLGMTVTLWLPLNWVN